MGADKNNRSLLVEIRDTRRGVRVVKASIYIGRRKKCKKREGRKKKKEEGERKEKGGKEKKRQLSNRSDLLALFTESPPQGVARRRRRSGEGFFGVFRFYFFGVFFYLAKPPMGADGLVR